MKYVYGHFPVLIRLILHTGLCANQCDIPHAMSNQVKRSNLDYSCIEGSMRSVCCFPARLAEGVRQRLTLKESKYWHDEALKAFLFLKGQQHSKEIILYLQTAVAVLHKMHFIIMITQEIISTLDLDILWNKKECILKDKNLSLVSVSLKHWQEWGGGFA